MTITHQGVHTAITTAPTSYWPWFAYIVGAKDQSAGPVMLSHSELTELLLTICVATAQFFAWSNAQVELA